MKVVIYRPSLDIRSGAGQLMRMQADGLSAAGERVQLACQRGAFKFLLRTGWRARRWAPTELGDRAAAGDLIVDHGPSSSAAHVVFVHNLYTAASRYVSRADWQAGAQLEAEYFAALGRDVPVVANSALVATALTEQLGLDPERVEVLYPGYDSSRFRLAATPDLRREARAALQVDDDTPLAGFVTSGDFEKRGLDCFLAAAERIAATMDRARFLIVGSKRLPADAARHPLVAARRVLFRPKSARPELWMAALDLFAYPARFEEFGIVLLEAQALGVPVLTTRRTGASECLPQDYALWLLDAPEPDTFAQQALALLADEPMRRALAAAGLQRVVNYGRDSYAASTVALIRDRKLQITSQNRRNAPARE